MPQYRSKTSTSGRNMAGWPAHFGADPDAEESIFQTIIPSVIILLLFFFPFLHLTNTVAIVFAWVLKERGGG